MKDKFDLFSEKNSEEFSELERDGAEMVFEVGDSKKNLEIDSAYLVRRIEGLEERIKMIETSLAYFLFDQEQMEEVAKFATSETKYGNT